MNKFLLLCIAILSSIPAARASLDVPPDPYSIQCLSETDCYYANGRKVTEKELHKLAALIKQEEANEPQEQ